MNSIIETLNQVGVWFVGFSADMLIQASALIVLLFAVDWFLRKRIRSVIRYWIWTLVLVKLLLPPSLVSPIGLGQVIPSSEAIVNVVPTMEFEGMEDPEEAIHFAPVDISPMATSEVGLPEPVLEWPSPETEAIAVQETVSPQPGAVLSWRGLALLVWAGTVVTLGLLLLQRAVLVKRLVAQATPCSESLSDVVDDCRARLGLSRSVSLRLTPVSGSPAVCGLFRPVILMPRDLVKHLKPHDLKAVLLHELAHVIRGDLWLNLVQTVLQILFFYNPLLWLANWQIRRIRENAVDEAVLVALRDKAPTYPEALVGVARLGLSSSMVGLRLIGLVENKSELNRRVRRILARPCPKTARLGLVGFTILALGLLLLPMAGARQVAEDLPPAESEALSFCVTGRVTDLAGRPVPDVEIRANCGMGTLMPTGRTVTDEDGTYKLEFGPGMRTLDEETNTWGAGFQVATIHASKPGYFERTLCKGGNLAMADNKAQVPNDWRKNFVDLVLPNEPHQLNFVMEPSASLEGRVINLAGKPVKDLRLWVTGDQLYPSSSALTSVTTDQRGWFTIDDVPIRKFQLMCEDAKGRDVEIPFRLSGRGPWYMKILHNTREHQTFTLKIIGLSREPDILKGSDVPPTIEAASIPLPEVEQLRLRQMLTRMRKANQYWLVRPPATIQSYAYAFTLGEHEPVLVHVDDPSRATGAKRQGISYYSAIHRLAAMADKVVFTASRQEGDNIALDFVLPMRMKMGAGNGISGQWRGYFSSSLSSGTLWLDQTRWVPIRLETRAGVEHFVDYAAIDEGAYAPLGITIYRSEDVQFDWRFKLHGHGLWLLDEARYGPAEKEQRDIVALVHDVRVKGQPGLRSRPERELRPYDWQRTDAYMPPNPEEFFPNDAAGGKALDALFDAPDKDKRSDEEILSTVRKGFRRTSKHKTLVLSWIGNKYIWKKNPQHPGAIEIMYHAVPVERHYAVYFGLSVMKNKSPNVLRTLADICMQREEVGRITWGIGNQKEALVEIIRAYANDKDPQRQQTAKVLLKHFAGEQDFEQWKRDEILKQKRADFGDQMPALREQLLTGNSRTRRTVLDQINRSGLTGLMDDSFLEALIACGEDPDHRVRSAIPRMVGNGWIWGSDPQKPEAIALAMSLSRDEVRDIRYNAVYFGLSTVRDKSEAVIERLIDMALADHENNLYGRITWGLRGANPDLMARVLKKRIPEASSSLHDKGSYYFLYKQLLKKDPPPVLDWNAIKQAYPERLWIIEYSSADGSGEADTLWKTLKPSLPQDLWIKQMRSIKQRNACLLLVQSEADSKKVISIIESLDRFRVGHASPIPGALLLYIEELDQAMAPVTSAPPAGENAIQKLIDAAQPGQTVTIPNGTHAQAIRINKPLTLRGESRDGCVFKVMSDGPAIHVEHVAEGQVRLEGITVAWQMVSPRPRRDSSPNAVWILNSQTVVEDCWIKPLTPGTSLAPVALRVDGPQPVTVNRCRFDGFEYTVCFGKGAQGQVTNCLVLDGGHQGVTGYDDSDLTVSRCIVSGFEYHGIRCTGGRLTVRDCLIADMQRCGIYLGNKNSQGSISNCLFMNNHSGVAGYYLSRYDVKNNVFLASSQSAIGAWDTCELTVEDNVFAKNAKAVVVYHKEGPSGNVIKTNGFWENEVDLEDCAATGKSIKEDPLFVRPDQGDFSMRTGPVKTAKLGLSDPSVLQSLWDVYRAVIQ